MRAPVSGGVGGVEMRLPIRVAPHRRGLGTALYQLLPTEILLVPHNHVTWVHIAPLPVGLCTVGPVKESAELISLVSFEGWLSGGTELGAVPDLHMPLGRCCWLAGHLYKKVRGF